MLDFTPKFESPVRWEKKTIVVDSNIFPVCTTDKTMVEKKSKTVIVFAHHDGEKLNVTIVDPLTGSIIQNGS